MELTPTHLIAGGLVFTVSAVFAMRVLGDKHVCIPCSGYER